MTCVFCEIAQKNLEAYRILEDDRFLAFLDKRPLFPGHCLLIPKKHFETFPDLPENLTGPLFTQAQRLSKAMENGLGADGSFVAVNNKISQSVSHLHVHVVPRKKGDGLRGFFWPRQAYRDPSEMLKIQRKLQSAF